MEKFWVVLNYNKELCCQCNAYDYSPNRFKTRDEAISRAKELTRKYAPRGFRYYILEAVALVEIPYPDIQVKDLK